MKNNQPYHGWKNYQTWNVSLWIGGDEGLYRLALEYMRNRAKIRGAYLDFIKDVGLENCRTPDKIKYRSRQLCCRELDSMMAELR